MDTARSEHWRRIVTGFCMIAAPLAMLVGELMHPEDESEAADQLGVVAGDLDRWYSSHLVLFLAFLVLIPALLGLAHLLHRARPMHAFVGGGMTIIGLVAVGGIIGAEGFGGYLVSESADAESATAVWEGLIDSSRMMPLYMTSLLFNIGVLVMGYALLRSRVVASWSAMAVMLGAVLMGIGFPAGLRPVILVGMAAFLVGMASIGYAVLTETDEEWATTPEFRGFRRGAPAMG